MNGSKIEKRKRKRKNYRKFYIRQTQNIHKSDLQTILWQVHSPNTVFCLQDTGSLGAGPLLQHLLVRPDVFCARSQCWQNDSDANQYSTSNTSLNISPSYFIVWTSCSSSQFLLFRSSFSFLDSRALASITWFVVTPWLRDSFFCKMIFSSSNLSQ